MLRRIFENISESLTRSVDEQDGAEKRERAIRHASVVLMIDVALADKYLDDAELGHIVEFAKTRFELNADEASELINAARSQAEELTSLHEFTQLLHNSLNEAEKEYVVAALWDIAHADGDLDKHEDALVLKISDALHVPRARVMRLKHDAALKS